MPKAILDSEFNVRKYPDEEVGQAHRRHFLEDPRFYGARLEGPGPGWSGKRQGLTKYGPVTRALTRHPPAMQRLVGRSALAGNAIQHLDEEPQW